MTTPPVELASLLCSRLCHDLLSPVGALNNGLELLADETDPEMRARCFELLTDSASASAQKLKFFRLAFGAAGGFGESVDNREPKALVEGLLADKPRIMLNWTLDEQTLPKPAVKILLNLALIGIESLVRGGQLDIGAESGGGRAEIVVRAAGEKIAMDETIGRALTGELQDDELSSRTAAAYMISELAASADGQIQVVLDDESLVMGAALNT
ncbi:histidine phosphotransferase family protein [Sphingorhabdus sp. Alg239-R122]|uniref:histidine phosphotransferase family protein n=1 Tax=Sphingorhabdus sp. Alg239-R122 TaxID=2305989 RepID=UPI0013DD5A54|nr:histidine phosphotransferase family protein [Sphingorhabdus sp. Alg239-R122]